MLFYQAKKKLVKRLKREQQCKFIDNFIVIMRCLHSLDIVAKSLLACLFAGAVFWAVRRVH